MSNELFLNRWREAVKARSDERAAEKVKNTDDDEDDQEEEVGKGPSTMTLLRPSALKNPALFAQDTKEYWDAFAGQLVRQYLKFVVEPSSASALAKAVTDSVLEGAYKGDQNKSSIAIVLEADNLWESTVRPWDKKPSPNQLTVLKLLQGVLTARNAQANEDGMRVAPQDQDMLILCDGGRDALKSVLPGA